MPLKTLPAAERENYPLVKYWYRHEWNAAELNVVAHIGAGTHGKARAAQGENVTLRFIEDEDGNIIDGFRATTVRRFARELWASLNSVGKAPKTWGKVDASIAAQYRNEMERKFPELHLCDNSWKADLIATLNYPSWYNNNVEKEGNSKRMSDDPLPDTKRPRSSADGPVTSIRPPSHVSRKKRTNQSARVPSKGIDSQLPEEPVSSSFQFLNGLIHLQSSQNFPLTEGLETLGDTTSSQSPIECDPLVESLGSRSRPRSRVSFHRLIHILSNYVSSKVQNPLFSVPSAIANLEKNNQTSTTFISNEELAVTSQMETPTATTMMMGQMTSVNQMATTTGVDQIVTMTTVDQLTPGTVMDPAATMNQMATTTGVDQTVAIMAVDQPTPGTVMDPAAATMNQIATEISNTLSPPTIFFDTTTTAPADASAATALADSHTTVPVDAPATKAAPASTAPASTDLADSHTAAPVDAPATKAAPASTDLADSHTIAPVDAPATKSPPVEALATSVPPIVGSGTGKKTGIMRPNPNSTTAR
jgi:hypothetical protein